MNENEIEKELMDLWVRLSADGKSKNDCIEIAQKFEAMAKYYDGIIDHYQKRVDHYRELKRMALVTVEANRALAAMPIAHYSYNAMLKLCPRYAIMIGGDGRRKLLIVRKF